MPSIAIKTYAVNESVVGAHSNAPVPTGDRLRENELDIGKEPNQHAFMPLITC